MQIGDSPKGSHARVVWANAASLLRQCGAHTHELQHLPWGAKSPEALAYIEVRRARRYRIGEVGEASDELLRPTPTDRRAASSL